MAYPTKLPVFAISTAGGEPAEVNKKNGNVADVSPTATTYNWLQREQSKWIEALLAETRALQFRGRPTAQFAATDILQQLYYRGGKIAAVALNASGGVGRAWFPESGIVNVTGSTADIIVAATNGFNAHLAATASVAFYSVDRTTWLSPVGLPASPTVQGARVRGAADGFIWGTAAGAAFLRTFSSPPFTSPITLPAGTLSIASVDGGGAGFLLASAFGATTARILRGNVAGNSPTSMTQVRSKTDTLPYRFVRSGSTIVTYNGTDVAYSTDDGATWIDSTLPIVLSGSNTINGGAAFGRANEVMLFNGPPAGSSINGALYSTDGINWQVVGNGFATSFLSQAFGLRAGVAIEDRANSQILTIGAALSNFPAPTKIVDSIDNIARYRAILVNNEFTTSYTVPATYVDPQLFTDTFEVLARRPNLAVAGGGPLVTVMSTNTYLSHSDNL